MLLKVGFSSIQWWVSCRYAEDFCSPMFAFTGCWVRHDQTAVKSELKHVKVRYATAHTLWNVTCANSYAAASPLHHFGTAGYPWYPSCVLQQWRTSGNNREIYHSHSIFIHIPSSCLLAVWQSPSIFHPVGKGPDLSQRPGTWSARRSRVFKMKECRSAPTKLLVLQIGNEGMIQNKYSWSSQQPPFPSIPIHSLRSAPVRKRLKEVLRDWPHQI